MIKKVSKISALIIVAGSVVSIIPAQSANAAVALQTLEGTITSAQAFDNGRYIFDGYKDAKDDTEIYYFDGTKDTALKELEGNYEKYGEKYVSFSEDGTLVDLSTGRIIDDNSNDEKAILDTKINNKVVKKAKRYSDTKNLKYIGKINNNRFDTEWFEYTVSNDEGSSKYILFADQLGNYIDSSEDLNITHYLKDGTKIAINTAEDLYEKGYTAEFSNALFSDESYIYRTVKITSKSDSSDSEVYMQKISKAQGKSKDGAYLPKEVKSYSLSGLNISTEIFEQGKGTNVITKDDSIYIISIDDSKATIKKYDFVKERDFSNNAVTNDRIYKLIEDDDYDAVKNEKINAYDIDKDNNIWLLSNGKLSKVDGNTVDTMYTVDRTMNQLSVYDENDIVAWNSQYGIYSSVGGTTLREGWTQYHDGTWSYLNSDGSKKKGWLLDNGAWYFMDNNGVMKTGWLFDNGSWYYLNSNGSMKTGLLNDGGNIYYLNSRGQMQNNGWSKVGSDDYYFNMDGSAKTGWYLENNLWYYFDQTGKLLKNTVVDGYKIGRKGFWVK